MTTSRYLKRGSVLSFSKLWWWWGWDNQQNWQVWSVTLEPFCPSRLNAMQNGNH